MTNETAPFATSTVMPLLTTIAVALASWSCGPTIEEQPTIELVEHRIEPCEQWCSAQLDPECGAIIEEQAFRSADECAQDCAAVEPVYAWTWARRDDGTDACAEEWFAAADCIDALSCDEQRAFFRRPGGTPEYPCEDVLDARRACYNAALDREGD